jgi:two-component system response regulator FixJ
MASDNLVYVIDDDEAARQSLQFLLMSARMDVRCYESATAFLADLPNAEFGCIITDVRMPGLSGVELLKRLKERDVRYPVIVITGHGDVQLAVEAMKAGATDFFEKPFDDELLLASLKSALGRAHHVAQREAERNQLQEKLASLSNREREVLEGLVAGKANKAIAFDLSISPRTIEIYRANVMTKMGARSLSDLVRMALAAGVLSGAAD